MQKTRACIWLTPADRTTLEGWISGRNSPQKLVWRARIVLLSADRVGVMAIARAVGKSKVTVGRWQERYLAQGIAGLRRDATRPGRKAPLSAATIKQVLDKTLHEKPPGGTHWSIRKMAAATGLSYTSVQRIWKAHQLKPHQFRTFKLSNDKRFAEKVQGCKTSSVCISIRPTTRWCCQWTKKARSRRWIAPSLACRSRRGVAAR